MFRRCVNAKRFSHSISDANYIALHKSQLICVLKTITALTVNCFMVSFKRQIFEEMPRKLAVFVPS